MSRNFISLIKEKDYYLLIVLILLIFFFNSVNWAIYNIDSQHYAQVFLNALEFNSNLNLYKDIPEQYGILNVTLNSLILKFFGNNIINIIYFYNLIYSLTILFISIIFFKISNHKLFTITATLLILVSNPVVQIPWGNYLSFFFLSIVILFYFQNFNKKFLFIGFFLSMSVLSRENNIYSCFAILLTIITLEYIKNKNINFIKPLLLSFFFPFLIFFIYLLKNNLFNDWYFFSRELFNILSDYFIKDYEISNNTFINYLILTKNFFHYFNLSLISHKNFRSLIFLLIFIINFYFLIKLFKKIIKKKKLNLDNYNQFFIIVLSITQLSNALHLTEAFRLATGFIFGILLFSYIKNQRIIIISFLTTLALIIISYSYGASYYPKYLFFNEKKDHSYTFSDGYFKNIKFNKKTKKFYEELRLDCNQIKENFDLKYYYNFTSNSFLGNYCGLQKKQTFHHFFQFYQNQAQDGFLSKDYYKNYQFDGKTIIFDFSLDIKSIKERYPNAIFIKIFEVNNMPLHFTPGFLTIVLLKNNSSLIFDPFLTFKY